jgi:hypothetical protein
MRWHRAGRQTKPGAKRAGAGSGLSGGGGRRRHGFVNIKNIKGLSMAFGSTAWANSQLAREGASPYKPGHSAREGGLRGVFSRPRPVLRPSNGR